MSKFNRHARVSAAAALIAHIPAFEPTNDYRDTLRYWISLNVARGNRARVAQLEAELAQLNGGK